MTSTTPPLPTEGNPRPHQFDLEFAVVMAALLVRLAFLLLPQNRVDDLSFSNEITNIAISLSQGHGFSSPFPQGASGPTAWIPPIYPFLCSLIMRAVGGYVRRSIAGMLVMNSIFSALTCIPLMRSAERLFNRRVAVISGWTFALLPYFARWSVTWIWETTLSTLFMTWLLWRILRLRDNDHPRSWIYFGIIWGVSMLNNPSSMTLVGIGFLWLLHAHGRKIWKHIALAILVCGVIIFPWLVRNRLVMGKWIFIRSNFGFELALGNYHESRADCWMGHHPWQSKQEFDQYVKLGETEYVARKGAEAKKFIAAYPREFLRLCWWRFQWFWNGEAMRMRPEWQWYWLPWLYPTLTATASCGLLLMLWRRVQGTMLLFYTILLYPWPYYLDCVQTRFRHLIDPMLLMITVYLLIETVRFFTLVLQRIKTAREMPRPDTAKDTVGEFPPGPLPIDIGA